jgi:hypothetical protein
MVRIEPPGDVGRAKAAAPSCWKPINFNKLPPVSISKLVKISPNSDTDQLLFPEFEEAVSESA